jgi:type III pantothenate kinase
MVLLAIDIGNTNICFGIFKSKKLIKRLSIPTKKYAIRNLRNSLGKIAIDDSIICSVVPQVSHILKRDLKEMFGKRPYILSEDVKAPIKNLYRRPKQVGQDRLVNAYAGILLFGSPLIIVDFGTAITLDAVSKKGEYLGGLIVPGLGISLEALAEGAALLPKIRLEKPKEFIGRDTGNSMLSGIVYGFAALTDELAERIKQKIGRSARVVGTGGNIHFIREYCRNIDKVEGDLTLKGLNLVYLKSCAE